MLLILTHQRRRVVHVHVTEHVIEIPTIRDDEAVPCVVSTAEEAILLRACCDHLRPVVLFGLYMGLRLGELQRLPWTDIDWRLPAVRVVSIRAKGRRRRQVPRCHTALDILRELPQDKALVFGYRDLSNTFRRTAKRAGLPDVTPKTLWHTLATRCLDRGVNIKTVQRWLGHASVKQTERYTHPTSRYERRSHPGPGRQPPRNTRKCPAWPR